MRDPGFQDGLKMTLTQRNEKIQTVVAYRPAEMFAPGVTAQLFVPPWRPIAVTPLFSSLEKMLRLEYGYRRDRRQRFASL